MAVHAIVLAAMLLVPIVSMAEAGPPADASEKQAAPAADAKVTPPPVSDTADVNQGPPGDVVTLKGGRVYRGFQVVGSTSAEVILQVMPGVTIDIPRRQIVSVDYDDIDPAVEAQKRKAVEDAAKEAATALLSGQKVSPEIQAKLRSDVSNPPIKFDQIDLAEAISQLNRRPNVSGLLELDKPVKQMRPEEKQWTFDSSPGMSLAAVLEAMKKSMPNLATIIQNDKVVITDEKTAREILGPSTPGPNASAPATPPPSAANP